MSVVCLGDSLTEACDVAPGERWHALSAARLEAEFVNSGIGGDTSAGLLSRFYPDVVARRPQAVILLGGVNDLWWDIDPGAIQANLFAMACQARSHRILPVIGVPPPVDARQARTREMFQPLAGWDECCRKLTRLAHGLRSAARSCVIDCFDFHSLFLTPGGEVRSELYLENGLHPNPLGHRVMADAVVEIMSRLRLPSPS